jgi:tRNA (guanine37-N1)-methyltransferase
MQITVVTLFPELIDGFVASSLLGRALGEGLLRIETINPRDYASDRHRSVDDTPYGGGAGMVLRADVMLRALVAAQPPKPVIGLAPAGKVFNQRHAHRLAELSSFTLVCGRYEGFDHRIELLGFDEMLSIGDFVLIGGEVAALAIIEAVARLVPGMLNNRVSVEEESFAEEGLIEYPQYTRPRSVSDLEVPEVLLSGDHEAIRCWRKVQSILRTFELRPDLIVARGGLNREEEQLLLDHGYADRVEEIKRSLQ